MSLLAKEWNLALSGELEAYLDAADHNIMDAAAFALHNIVTEGRKRLRDMVVGAGLSKSGTGEGRGTGRSLASAIRYEVYPSNRVARNPAALLYVQPSAIHIFEAFENDTIIQAKQGRFLTIPVPGSPADRKVAGDKPRGETVLERLKARGVEVRFVKATPNRPAMLVADSVRLGVSAKGRTRVTRAARTKAGAYASGAQSVPLFFLVPRARIGKRLSLKREFERLANEFVDAFSREIAAVLARFETGELERSYPKPRSRRR